MDNEGVKLRRSQYDHLFWSLVVLSLAALLALYAGLSVPSLFSSSPL